MPSFSESLEKTLHNALKAASERHHEYATLEHLLYALIDDDHAAEVMRACGVALDDLQSAVVHYLDTELDSLKVEGHSDPSPTSGFQRVVQRAIPKSRSATICSAAPPASARPRSPSSLHRSWAFRSSASTCPNIWSAIRSAA